MEKNMLTNLFRTVKNLLTYQPPQNQTFVSSFGDQPKKDDLSGDAYLKKSLDEIDKLRLQAEQVALLIDEVLLAVKEGKFFKQREELAQKLKQLERQQAYLNDILLSYDSAKENEQKTVAASLEENKKILETIYRIPDNKDVVIREIMLPGKAKIKAMLVFMDGLIDKMTVNMAILQPLMLLSDSSELQGEKLAQAVLEKYLPSGQASLVEDFAKIQNAVNTGDAVLFLEGCMAAITVEAKGFEHRGVDRPLHEQSIRGAQNAFCEVLRVNTALVRNLLRSSDLVTEMITLGRRGRLNCAIMYLDSVTNPALVKELKKRIKNIKTDYISDVGVLEDFIEDHPLNPFPQTLSTERPDRVAAHLAEGRIAIMIDGCPFVHVIPCSFFTLMHTVDDFNHKYPYANFLRMLRILGIVLATTLPAFYLAISTFHQEAIPTDLLLAIAAARSEVPFPTIVEILLMEVSFELIREGGLRIPGILGSTLGIVGALILGQAAVTAKIVSPIMVIIVSVTGLASFTIPEYRLASAVRLLRFVFMLVGAIMGLVGITCALLVTVAVLCSMKSFGVPYMAPLAPKTTAAGDVVLRLPVYNIERRPDELDTKDVYRQSNISRKYLYSGNRSDDDG